MSASGTPPVSDRALAALAAAPAEGSPGPVVLVDGRSGAGKTTMAAEIAAAAGAAVVHMDELYPGWHGLEAGSRYAVDRILRPLAEGRPARWRRWDWHAGRRAEERSLAPGTPLVLEGCGALSRAARQLARHAVWIELDEETRRRRAAGRDGGDWWWQLWRAQEDAFYRREGGAALADEVLPG